MNLTDRSIKAFVAKSKSGKKLIDGDGLYLFISSTGKASWQVKYRISGKEKIYSIGYYPKISLSAARTELGEIKALIKANKDPAIQCKKPKIPADIPFESHSGCF